MIGRSFVPRLLILSAVALSTVAVASAADSRWSGNVAYKNRNPAVAWGTGASASNGFVVWENERLGILGRSLDTAGNPLGAIVTLKANDVLPPVPFEADLRQQKEPAAVIDRNGRLFVVWTEELAHVRTDFFYEQRTVLDRDVWAQSFDANGVALGAAFKVHSAIKGLQSRPAVARVTRGRNTDVAVVAWDSDASAGGAEGVFARAFQISNQAALGADLAVAPGAARRPAAAGSGAVALIAWEGGSTPALRGLFSRAVDGETLALGKTNKVSNASATTPSQAALTPTPGGFLAAWTNAVTVTRTRVLVRPLANDGSPTGPQQAVSSEAARAESAPALSSRGERVAVLWLYWGSSLPEGILAVEVDKKGSPIGTESWLNEQLPTGSPYRSAVTIAPSGDVVGAWQGPDGSGQWSIRSGKLD